MTDYEIFHAKLTYCEKYLVHTFWEKFCELSRALAEMEVSIFTLLVHHPDKVVHL